MKIQFKHQGFQQEAARAVVDVFSGQPLQDALGYYMEQGQGGGQIAFESFRNQDIVLSDESLRNNIRKVQRAQDLKPIESLQRTAGGQLALSIEMETGTGKTYTYIKTMYELYKHYGWTKYIIMVPSVAIREGVIKSLQMMADHFAEEYGERMQHFVYDSRRLAAIKQFTEDSKIHVMVINTQAFNARDAARRISTQLEEFAWRRPIDVIAETHPILIIDEPQSVLGANRNNNTRQGLREFNPLFSLLYSATHRPEDLYNQVYRLDAIDAFNKRLVKKIEVIGIEQVGTTATSGYVYLDSIVLSKRQGEAPRARISFDAATRTGLRTATRLVGEGFDLYGASGKLEAYRDGYLVERIDGVRGCIRLSSGQEIYEGQEVDEEGKEVIRRTQIRTTIEKHLERERQLYRLGIKVLSLFFIDAVNRYRIYDTEGETRQGRWAEIFEEEYSSVVGKLLQNQCLDADYRIYLEGITAEATHAGYFAQDRRGRMIDSTVRGGESSADDPDAYQLIMRDKERLLSLAEPTRFIFSHSALKEGWDNPNVFQICTLKQGNSEVRKRQEVGRGMRLSVDQDGVRQDSDQLGDGVYDVNVLTIVASESYKAFAEALQTELAESITSRPRLVTKELFEGKRIVYDNGEEVTLSGEQAMLIMEELIFAGYVRKQQLTDKYYEAKQAGELELGDWQGARGAIVQILDKLYNSDVLKPEDGRGKDTAHFQEKQFAKQEFQELWKRINRKTYYEVSFNTEDLIRKSVAALDESLHVTEIRVSITQGQLEEVQTREELAEYRAMQQGAIRMVRVEETVARGVRYDLVGELVQKSGLKRITIARILHEIKPQTFEMYHRNPEEFIIRAGNIINAQKAIAVVEQITYRKLNQCYESSIFSTQELRGRIDVNAIRSQKSLYDLVVVDSLGVEKRFAEQLEQQDIVEVYTKLPRGFYINTPVGKYNPDWAIVFREGTVKHIYFVAETKGSEDLTQLRAVEEAKIKCAKKHFASISDSQVKFGVVTGYDSLYDIVSKD